MPKPTARRSPSRRKGLRTKKGSGLIAKRQTRKRSVGTKSALDNRSHRTLKLSCEGQAGAQPNDSFVMPRGATNSELKHLVGFSATLACGL